MIDGTDMTARRATSQGDAALARLRDHILRGGYGAGDRLPAERQLVAALDLGRADLRRALEALEREGAIWRHVGKGTFVAQDPRDARTDAPGALARQTSPLQMMRARLCIEPALAREAALNATGEAMIRLRLEMERARAASSWQDYELQDDRFHRAVAACGGNPLLLALFEQLARVRRAVAGGRSERRSAGPDAAHPSFAEHEAIVAAIERRAHDGAEQAMRRHLRLVSDRLFA